MSFFEAVQLGVQHNSQEAVRNVSLSVLRFEKIGIAGETGSGKSSLLKMIAGLLQPARGTAWLNGQRILGPDEQLIAGHPQIAYLSQHFELRNRYRVHELMEMVMQVDEAHAAEIYRICQVDHLLQRWTNELSGGEKQRIGLARLLITAPSLLLLDEPFSNADLIHKRTMQQVLQQLGEALRITCIMVSHDAEDLLAWADRLLIMKDGVVVQEGKPAELYYNPLNEYTAGILGEYNRLPVSLLKGTDRMNPFQTHILLRPDELRISQAATASLQATIEQVAFHGPYFKLKLRSYDYELVVRTFQAGYQTGDQVYLAVVPAAARILP